MVICNDNLELRICLFERLRYSSVFGQLASHGDIAGMEENVSGGEGLALGIFSVRRRKRSLVMGVGDDAEAVGYGVRFDPSIYFPHMSNPGDLGDLGGILCRILKAQQQIGVNYWKPHMICDAISI